MADKAVERIKKNAERSKIAAMESNQCQRDKKQLKDFKKAKCVPGKYYGCKGYKVTEKEESKLKALKNNEHGKICNKQISNSVDNILKKKIPGIKF